jgi:hypothetical protein
LRTPTKTGALQLEQVNEDTLQKEIALKKTKEQAWEAAAPSNLDLKEECSWSTQYLDLKFP